MKLLRLWIATTTLLLVSAMAPGTAAQTSVHVTIAHTNDIHGQLLPLEGLGGMAEIATIIKEMNPDLVLDAGDLFTGTYLSDFSKGVPTIRAMNAIGYTAGTLGNHEFDYGQEALRARLSEAKFPLLSANVTGPVPIKKFTVVTVHGIRFGLIGVTTGELMTATHPKNLRNVRVSDPVQAIRQVLPEVRRQSDFLIVTAHLTEDEERRVAAAFPEIRLIVGGHTHAILGPIRMGQTWVVKTGKSGRNVGRVDLEFDGKTLKDIQARLIPVQRVQPNPEVAGLLAPFEAQAAAKLSEVVAEALEELSTSSTAESALANLVVDALRSAGKTQIGIQNIGGIRARINRGPITWGEIFEVAPFENTVVTLKLTGAQLKRALGVRFLAVSGVRVTYDLRKPAGQKLVSVTLEDGTPIGDSQLYTVTTNDFLLAGGDGLSELARGREIRDSGILLRDALADYFKSRRSLPATLDGRIRVN